MTASPARVLILVALLLAISFPMPATVAAETPVVARPDLGGQARGPRHRLTPFLHPRGDDALRLARRLGGPVPSATVTGDVSSSVITGFPGTDESATLVDPPDGAIAVSDAYVVEAVNDALSVWTKTYGASGAPSVTPAIASADLNTFFGNNPNCYTPSNDLFGLLSDPSVDYDAAGNRFMLSMISFDQLFGTSSVCIAVSVSGDPTGFWYIYAFPVSPFNSLLDFPRAVVGNDNQIYLSGNLFLIDRSGNFVYDHARVYAFMKSQLYAGASAATKFVVAGNDPESGQPADSLTPARAVGVSGMYFLSASNPSPPLLTGSLITLWKWTDPFGSNQFSQPGSVAVATYAQPPLAIQPGNTDCTQASANCVATNDARNLAAYYVADPVLGPTVYGTHAIGCTQGGAAVACVQWYSLGNVDGAPTLVQQGVVDDAANPGRFRYFPSLAVDRNGNAALAYAFSSATEFPGIAYVPLSAGVQGAESVLKAGEATFISTRYGDYAGTALDPHDGLTIWHIEEYAKSAGTGSEWGTWISALQIAGAAPVSDFSIGAALASGSPSLVVPGGTETYTVTLNPLNGFTGTVTLSVSGTPTGASALFSANPVTLTGAPVMVTLAVTTGANTPAGSYTLTITGSGAGATHTTTALLTVGDFSIAAPTSKNVRHGKSVSLTVSVSAVNGFTGQVGLALSGLPSNATGTFATNPITFSAGGATSKTSTLTIQTSNTTPRGTYTVTVTGTGTATGGGGTVVHATRFTLTVQ